MDPQYEAIELEGHSVIKSYRVDCALMQQDHGWHYHPECELTYIIEGEGTRFVGDNVQHFGPGDLIFCGPNLPHCWTNDDTDDNNPNRNQIMALQFKPDCLGPDFLNSPDAKGLAALYKRAQRGLRITGKEHPLIVAQLVQLHEQSGLDRLTGFVYLLNLLSRCEQAEELTSELYITDTDDFNGGRIGKVMEYVKANLGAEITQSDVAELVAMTPQAFSRFFRATTGRTFVSFVNVMRIMEACKLLVNTDQDIIDVAFQCGYSNLSNFNRRFAELKQTTPRAYRKQHSKLG